MLLDLPSISPVVIPARSQVFLNSRYPLFSKLAELDHFTVHINSLQYSCSEIVSHKLQKFDFVPDNHWYIVLEIYVQRQKVNKNRQIILVISIWTFWIYMGVTDGKIIPVNRM